MTEQFTDKKTVGIPPDIVQVRHDTELYKIQAENSAATAAERADASGPARSRRASRALEARDWALVAQGFGARYARKGVHFGPDEPAFEHRYNGMLWIETNEATKKIASFKRWDALNFGAGIFLSDDLFLSDELFLTDSGEWTTFHV